MTDRSPRNGRRAYHHGDLRAALIAAAQSLLRESGEWGFTLREVARVAGVSHNAPYNHFDDKRALLAAVAEIGFTDLGAELTRRSDAVPPDAHENRIVALAEAYVGFGVDNPAMFRLMFSEDLAQAVDLPGLRTASEAAFGVLRDAIASAAADGKLSPDANGVHTLAAWALVHGLATLLIDGRVPVPAHAGARDALVAGVARALLVGMSVQDGGRGD
ncbi:MAG: TetR/AcrR family transcriptional regulator [Microvirga sp.]|nr:TetR/AcrR family transcriptional regulator [Microvirga sp.]